MPSFGSQENLQEEIIRGALSEPYQLTIRREGKADAAIEHHCTASIGVVVFVNHESNQNDILKWVDMSMYEPKTPGAMRFGFMGLINDAVEKWFDAMDDFITER